MEKRAIIVIVLAVLACCSISKANITNLWYADDGDGAVVCNATNWWGNSGSVTLCIDGVQHWTPGHVLGTVDTDSTIDPTLTISSGIANDTTFAWTAFTVNVYMNNPFTLTNAAVTVPGDWTVVSVSPVTSIGSNYVGTIEFDTGTAIPNDNVSELDFSYQLKFSGNTHYSFTQEMIPVPEPGTLGLLTISGLLLGGFTLARRQRRA